MTLLIKHILAFFIYFIHKLFKVTQDYFNKLMQYQNQLNS